MLKLIVVLVAGYLFFKIMKNAAYVAIEKYFFKKEIEPPDELIKCDNCGGFVGKNIAIKYKRHFFCSSDCKTTYNNTA